MLLSFVRMVFLYIFVFTTLIMYSYDKNNRSSHPSGAMLSSIREASYNSVNVGHHGCGIRGRPSSR